MAMIIKPENSSCYCSSTSDPIEPRPLTPPKPEDKYFHEVGAEMIDNHLIIRIEKDKTNKKRMKMGSWEPPCDCDVIEIKRPSKKSDKPKIVNGGDNNQILFRIHSKGHLNKKDDTNYKPQAVAYKINRSGRENDQCRKITIYPQLGGPVSQDVYTDHITEDDHDVYLLRVKKKNDAANNGKKRNLEVELRTPKLPPKPAVISAVTEPSNETKEATEKEVESISNQVKSNNKKNGNKNGKKK